MKLFRKALQVIAGAVLAIAIACPSPAGVVSQSGPRQYTASGGGSQSAVYEWDDDTPYAYVSPSKTASGACTEVDPCNPTQGLAIGPAASGDRVVIWLPGDFGVTTTNAAGQKYPSIVPTSGASATRRVIHKAQYPRSTNPAQYTRIRRSSNGGTIFGFYQNQYVIFDGFRTDTATGSPQTQAGGGSGEVSLFGCWESTGVKGVRLWLDLQGDNFSSDGNRSAVHIEQCTASEFADSYVTSTGSSLTGGAPHNNAGLMIYDSSDLNIHHNDFYNLPTCIWSKGQHIAASVFDIDIHHNKVDYCVGGIFVSNPIQTSSANYVRVYQNIITRTQIGLGVKSFNPSEPSGIVIVNNTVANGVRHETGSWQAVGFNTQSVSTAFQDGHIIVRNNAYHNIYAMNYLYDSGAQNDRLRWDYNGYSTYTQFAGDPEGSDISQAAWQGDTPQRDFNGLFSATSPSFVDAANSDFRLQAGSAYRNAGTDYLDLLGTGTSASINLGAYITSDMTDQIGKR